MRTPFFLFFLLLCRLVQAQVIETRPLITVTGEAVEKVIPDVAVIRYTVTEKITPPFPSNFNVLEQDKLDIDMKFVNESSLEKIRSLDVLKNNSSHYINIKEYIITLNDISKYKSLIYSLLKIENGEITSIEFKTSKLADHKNTARLKAIDAAKEKANMLASALNQAIGKAFTVVDNPSPVINWYDKNSVKELPENDVYLIYPAYISITANVTVSFELKF